jgi:hypothetical protein
MLSALFGKKKVRAKNPPWDEVRHEGVSIPIWKSTARDGQSRFLFGVSRVYGKRGESYYAKTLEIQNIKDILCGIEKLVKKLSDQRDVPLRDRHNLARISLVLERVLSSPEMKGEQHVNGHGEPSSQA